MRVLYITHLTERNGATTALRNIMSGMVGRGVEVGLIVPSIDGFICDEARKLGITVLFNFPYPWAMIKGQLSLKMWLLAQWKTYKLIKEFNPDIVHCNTGVIDYSLLGCLLTRTPMIWHAREYIDKYFKQAMTVGMRLHCWVMKLPFVHCIAITRGVFEHFHLSAKKDIVIYDGVINDENYNSIDLSTCDDVNVNMPSRYFLYVGTFTEGKGAHVIFEQFGKVLEKYPETHLCLACKYDKNSEYFKYCMAIAKEMKFEDNVHFLGFRTDVYDLMKHAVALVVPSRFEGFGFITVEAMYNNCLVIGRNTAGTKEQFDKGFEECGSEIGLRFNNDEELPELMVNSIEKGYNHMKRKAHDIVVTNYTVSKNVDNTLRFYNAL